MIDAVALDGRFVQLTNYTQQNVRVCCFTDQFRGREGRSTTVDVLNVYLPRSEVLIVLTQSIILRGQRSKPLKRYQDLSAGHGIQGAVTGSHSRSSVVKMG